MKVVNTRDLITSAVFAVIFVVITYAGGMFGLIGPAFMFVGYVISILLNGIVVMFLLSRVNKIGALTVVGLVVGIVMTFGHTILILPAGIMLGFIGDLIATDLGRTQRPHPVRCVVAYALMQVCMIVPLIPMIINADAYYAHIASTMGQEYADTMRKIFTVKAVCIWQLVAICLGAVGGVLGLKVVRKHFSRAGLTR